MRTVVAGGTGFVGAPFCERLAREGHEVVVLTRQRRRAGADGGPKYRQWHPDAHDAQLPSVLDGVDTVVNLCGTGIADKRWSDGRKREILQSRVNSTRALVQAMGAASSPPSLLINASGVGYYGMEGEEPATEASPPGTDFLAEVCVAWEREALAAEPLGVRVIRARLGVVLAADGGALARLAAPFRLFAGGTVGSGSQWVPWIHREDVMAAFRFFMDHGETRGAFNLTAPEPCRMRDLAATLGRVLHRPSALPVPGLAVRLLFGEMAMLVLQGRQVLPTALESAGFGFQFPRLEPALRAIYGALEAA